MGKQRRRLLVVLGATGAALIIGSAIRGESAPGEVAPLEHPATPATPATHGVSGEASSPGFVLTEVPEGGGIRMRTTCGGPEKRFILEANGSGAALFDYDGDGDLDVYLVNGSTLRHVRRGTFGPRNALYRNDGDWRFTDVSEASGLDDPGWGFGCAVGDIDNDGDPDLYVANFGPNVLFENRGDGTFLERAAASGVDDPAWGQSAGFADVDNDGSLDLYLCNKARFDPQNPPNGGKLCDRYGIRVFCGPLGLRGEPDRLYLGKGDGSFVDASDASGIREPEPSFGLGLGFLDFDEDGRVDIYVANDSVANFLFHNRGEARFAEIAEEAGVAYDSKGRAQAGMGVATGDYDADGRPDLLVTNFSEDYNTVYWNAGDGSFWDMTARERLSRASFSELGWGTQFVDFDNDADLDLYVANGHVYPTVETLGQANSYRQDDQVFLNDGAGKFSEAPDRIDLEGPPGSSRGAVFGDLDDDGDVDIVVVEIDEAPTVLENRGGNAGAWLRVRLVGTRSPRDGTGARVWVSAGGRTIRKEVSRAGSYCSAGDRRLHFGLGDAARVDRIEVRWPGGTHQVIEDVEARSEVTLHEDEGRISWPPDSPRLR